MAFFVLLLPPPPPTVAIIAAIVFVAVLVYFVAVLVLVVVVVATGGYLLHEQPAADAVPRAVPAARGVRHAHRRRKQVHTPYTKYILYLVTICFGGGAYFNHVSSMFDWFRQMWWFTNV